MPLPQQKPALDRQLTQATDLFSNGQYHQALLLYESVLRASPHHVDALNNAALTYLKLGHAETAVAQLEKALEANPSHENSFFNLVYLQVKRGNPVQAALTFHAHDKQIADSERKQKLARQMWPPHLPGTLFDDRGALNRRLVTQLHTSWRDTERSASRSFLYTALEMCAQTSTAILSCGGGLSTLLLARLAAQRDLDIWVLEHHPTWHAYLCAALEREGLGNALHVCHAPLHDYGAFVWYDVPSALPDAFDVVVYNRRPDSMSEDRYGLYPVLQNRLDTSCVLLLDDTSDPEEETTVLPRWRNEGNFAVEITRDTDTSFAVLSRSEAPRTPTSTPSRQRRALPPKTEKLLERLRQNPHKEQIFYRLTQRLVEAGYDERARDVFTTFEANIRASAAKQTLRNTLFDRAIDPKAVSPNPICIGGCGSSGTNLLRRILDAHSQIACGKEMSVFDRPQIYRMSLDELHDIYRTGSFSSLEEDMTFALTGEDNRSYCGLQLGNHGDYYHTPAEVLELFDHADSVADFLNKYFSTFAQKRGKRIWAEKTPNNIFCAEDFLEMYPEGRFIQMIRDGRDVCISLATRRNYDSAEAMARWNMAVEAGLRLAGRDRVYTVRYEELVLHPEETLGALFEWLHLPYEETVLQFNRKNEKNAHGYAESSIHTQSVFRWKETWSKLSVGGRKQFDLGLTQHLIATGYKSLDSEAAAVDKEAGRPSQKKPVLRTVEGSVANGTTS